MPSDQPTRTSWFRRPRRPVRWGLTNLFWRAQAAFWLAVAVLVGLGMLLTEDGWPLRLAGLLLMLLGVALAAWYVAHLMRPVGVPDEGAQLAAHLAAQAPWTEALAREGVVEVGLDRRKVVSTFAKLGLVLLVLGVCASGVVDTFLTVVGALGLVVVVLFAVLPHLEAVTASGPLLRVDSAGVRIARWQPVVAPWPTVVGARTTSHRGRVTSVIVGVTRGFRDAHRASAPLPQRLLGAAQGVFTGSGFVLPVTIDADPEALADWLDREARTR